MKTTAYFSVEDNDYLSAFDSLGRRLLELALVDALLAPCYQAECDWVMPTLICDPEAVCGLDPLSPIYPLNGARHAARLSRTPPGGRVAAFMRPCEVRAFVELVKLKQGDPASLFIISADCLGAVENRTARTAGGRRDRSYTATFIQEALTSGDSGELEMLAPACKVCEHPTAEMADLTIGLLGVDLDNRLLVEARSEKGGALLNALALPSTEAPKDRSKAIEKLIRARTAARDAMFAATRAATGDLSRLADYLATCVNCYNCRVACPVCYCRTCVFTTDVFDHPSAQYLGWARRRGAIRMPTDTLFYHLTRLAHVSTACVGCGQCSNACPNEIPLMELFRTVALCTQTGFDYEAGRHLDEPPPLSTFAAEEFADVVGLGD
ncbi:MAG: Coenzyme F420 hydrogenase/dehydrogenase, beta subunit C-terminal domain [Desulfosarcinaceae bacterium]|nr:Coenzyme F420 hydrogenase/dehydrogenase, beta subunit C-terminal domain [Desulfosarcinaceae bacterium]